MPQPANGPTLNLSIGDESQGGNAPGFFLNWKNRLAGSGGGGPGACQPDFAVICHDSEIVIPRLCDPAHYVIAG